jgi:hypothetical protein
MEFRSTHGCASFPTEDGDAHLEWAEIPNPSNENVSLILEAIANVDFFRTPRITDYVYFINRSRNIILNMYDDRGLDVIATNRESLVSLYRSRPSWILAYDLPRIRDTFENCG